jgi:DNA repair exonuclease SbcCD nuclease subunit
MAEINSAVFVLLNYKTNFQFCQSMFSAGLVRPDARISHSRCRPAVTIDGKNRKRILWLLHSLEHKYTFQPSLPPPPLQFSFHFFICFSSSAIIEEILMRMNEEQRKFSEIHHTRQAVRGRHRAQLLYPGSLYAVRNTRHTMMSHLTLSG